jgi:thymidylate synthase ThyX
MSLAQESTRYCRYNKDDMEFILPYWANLNTGHYEWNGEGSFIGDGFISDSLISSGNEELLLWHLSECEDNYKILLEKGLKAQEAREILPLALKSQLIMTGFESDWKDFLDKRFFEKTGRVHPDMFILAGQIQEQLKLEI